jgi:uncharacterized phage-associated protein
MLPSNNMAEEVTNIYILKTVYFNVGSSMGEYGRVWDRYL